MKYTISLTDLRDAESEEPESDWGTYDNLDEALRAAIDARWSAPTMITRIWITRNLDGARLDLPVASMDSIARRDATLVEMRCMVEEAGVV